jgi:hypothetical protein
LENRSNFLFFCTRYAAILRGAPTICFLAWFHWGVVTNALSVSSPGYFWLSAVRGLVEAPAASLAGAWLYHRLGSKG